MTLSLTFGGSSGAPAARRALAHGLLNVLAMSFANVVDRVRFEVTEMPSLELTMGQACRLWNLGADDCRYVLDALVDAGFLRWTPQRTIVRVGRGRWGNREASYIPVVATVRRDNIV